MFYDFILKTIICKSLIFIKTISTPKTISKSLIFLILVYQLLLIKLNFKLYLTRVGALWERVRSAGRPNPGARGPGAGHRAAVGGRPSPAATRAAERTGRGAARAAARGCERVGGGACGAGRGLSGGLTAGWSGGRYLP